MFLDPWGTPILYYRANRSAFRLVSTAEIPGIFRQEDNGVITGTEKGLSVDVGVDFGAGQVDGILHEIVNAAAPEPTDTVDDILTNPNFNHTLARIILDPSSRGRPTPVNKDSYLLISAGPDSRYGTDDDVINWEKREQE